MSTRSYIGKQLENGKVKYIYCHFDGYEAGVGKTLKTYYTDEKKVDELLELGDLSSLGKKIDSCFAYGRDRGEDGTEARIKKSMPTDEYNYLFVDGKWKSLG